MDYQINVKPAEMRNGMKYRVIELTDIKLHLSNKKPTLSIGQKIMNAFKFGRPGRIYSSIKNVSPIKDNLATFQIPLSNDPKLMSLIEEAEKAGEKILFQLPKEGIPIYAGDDLNRFLKSKNGGRLTRGIEKGKTQ